MTSTVKTHKAIEKLDENVRYCLWALISAPFEDQLKEMTTISKDVLEQIIVKQVPKSIHEETSRL